MKRKHDIRMIESGDYIIVPLDDEIRKVARICVVENVIYMTDAGCIGGDEEFEVLLPSEVEG